MITTIGALLQHKNVKNNKKIKVIKLLLGLNTFQAKESLHILYQKERNHNKS